MLRTRLLARKHHQEIDDVSFVEEAIEPRFYGWWIVTAAFLNLFFVVGIIFYGFPVFIRISLSRLASPGLR